MTYDPELREIHGPDGRVRLTPWQSDVLCALRDRPGRLVSRDALMIRLYAHRPDDPPGEHALDVVISRLRAALRRAGVAGGIETVRGAGWVWRPVRDCTQSGPNADRR